MAATTPRVRYVETHAGEGTYALGPTGEWSEGIGRLWSMTHTNADDGAVARYVTLCRELSTATSPPEQYPGSPAFARALLGSEAALGFWERDEMSFNRLAAHARGDARVQLTHGDGLRALRDEVHRGESSSRAVVVLVDPPYTQKTDWILIPDALVQAVATSTRACVLLWYPVKSLTRPNAMLARLQAAGVSGTIVELITTPLDHKRNRLNGSGVLLVHPPAGALETLAAAAPIIGQRCATHAGAWSFRMRSW